RTGRPVSDEATLGETDVATAADDDVIVQAEIEQPRTLRQLPRESNVFPARRGIAARVVVQQDHRRRGFDDGRLEYLARMDQAGRQRPLRYHAIAQEAVLRVEQRDAEHLAFEVFHQRPEGRADLG